MSRKNEAEQTITKILDVATELFFEKGFEQTTMQNLVERIGMSKGAIFYHFESKEAIMEAVIDRMMAELGVAVTEIANNPNLTAHEKMIKVIMMMNKSGGEAHELIEDKSGIKNATLHQAGIVASVHQLTPILAKIVEQGISEGVYQTPYPFETIEFILASNQFYFDQSAFGWQKDEMYKKGEAFIRVMTLSLGAAEGSFDFLLSSFKAQLKKECNLWNKS